MYSVSIRSNELLKKYKAVKPGAFFVFTEMTRMLGCIVSWRLAAPVVWKLEAFVRGGKKSILIGI